MFKNLLIILVLVIVAAMPVTSMAGSDWVGINTDWDDLVNWYYGPGIPNPPDNDYHTEHASIDPGDVTWYGLGTEMPLIDETNYTQWGVARIRNSAVVTQTGGYHEWMNGTGTTSYGFNLYAGAELHMTGGTHITDRAAVGMSGLYVGSPGVFGTAVPAGYGRINIWGAAEFRIRENPYVTDLYDLSINDGSLIDIREDGVLRVPVPLQALVDGYITAGQIVAGEAASGYWLYTVTVGDEYVVTATNEVPIPGDADRDRDVDDDDATILASNWLTPNGAGWSDGDFNYDGAVNEEDASMLAANYGITAPPAASVPEPGTLLLFCLGLGSLALIRRR